MDEQVAGGKISVVEYLRGFAALSVAWFHLTNQYPEGPVRASGSMGWLGVAIFFVISGFVLPYSIWARHGARYGPAECRSFMWRRVVRIEAPYLISVALTVVLWQLSSKAPGAGGVGPQVSPAQILSHVLYLPKAWGYEWLQPVYWTLGYEFAFYMLLSVSYAFVLRFPLLAIGSLTALAELATLIVFHRLDACIPLFGIGAAVFMMSRSRMRPAEGLSLVLILAIVSAVSDVGIAVTGALTACVLLLAPEFRLAGRKHRVMLGLGAISYSLYVTHVIIGGRIVKFGGRFAVTELELLVVSALAVLASVVFARMYWRLVETPFVRLAHRRRAEPARVVSPN